MGKRVLVLGLFVVGVVVMANIGRSTTPTSASNAVSYDCASLRPEMAGFHNMVLFGVPGEQKYVYHLPLFAGGTNGTSGHVLMHVYQGLWKVELEPATNAAYDLKYGRERSTTNPFPFFTIGPKGNPFKVPEMICNSGFTFSAWSVYGHIESNPEFPAPEKLQAQLSTLKVQQTPVLAQRFDGSSRTDLTYLIFGTKKQRFMVHVLTDDENSFDQIVGVEILNAGLEAAVEAGGSLLVRIPTTPSNGLVAIAAHSAQSSPNNKWKLPVSPLGSIVTVSAEDVAKAASQVTGKVKVTGEVYFNANDDLKK